MMRYARGAGWLTGLVLVVVVLPWPVWADYEAGQRAWKAGRHGEALTEWQAAAAAGDRRAMLALGRVFAKGLGTPQNYVEAHKWFNLAASRGEAGRIGRTRRRGRQDDAATGGRGPNPGTGVAAYPSTGRRVSGLRGLSGDGGSARGDVYDGVAGVGGGARRR